MKIMFGTEAIVLLFLSHAVPTTQYNVCDVSIIFSTITLMINTITLIISTITLMINTMTLIISTITLIISTMTLIISTITLISSTITLEYHTYIHFKQYPDRNYGRLAEGLPPVFHP